jgi:hypothetical protein
MKKLLKNQSGTAEIVGTVLFLLILFFFFSNVFLWHNQVTREMDQVVADKTNSAVQIEATVLNGSGINTSGSMGRYYESGPPAYPYSLIKNFTFGTGIDTPEKLRLVADLRLGIYASYSDTLGEPCFVYVWDYKANGNQGAWVATGLMVMSGSRWYNTTLSLPSDYIDGGGSVKVRIADASSQLGVNDTNMGWLDLGSMAVYADSVALEVVNLGGTDAALSRLWIVTATDHVYADLNGTAVAGGSMRTIAFSAETMLVGEGDDLVVNYVPQAGQTVVFRVLTTLGNTAACSISFPS